MKLSNKRLISGGIKKETGKDNIVVVLKRLTSEGIRGTKHKTMHFNFLKPIKLKMKKKNFFPTD